MNKALKKVTDYYKENKYTPSNNEYTNIILKEKTL